MGRLKDSVTRGLAYRPGGGRSGGGGFVRCTRGNPCPVCGREKFCTIGEVAVLCTRVAEGSVRTGTNDCGEFYVHMLDGAAPERRPPPPRAPAVERAPVEVRDRAYRAVLAQLRLDDADRAALRARGLPDAHVDANGYRTLPVEGRARLALAVVGAVGEAQARAVPGVFWKEEGRRGWWSFGGSAGVLVPLRDLDGRVAALKVRRRDPIEEGGPRYLYVASTKHGGPSAASVVHVPEAARALRGSAPLVAITEGELKADVATALAGVPFVSIPGVGGWAQGVDLALAWGARRVEVCLDMDRLHKRDVADAARCIVSELRREGFVVGLPRWDRRFKGIDDYLAARARGEVQRARQR